MRAVCSGDIIQDIAAAYGIRHDRAIKISRGWAPNPLSSALPQHPCSVSCPRPVFWFTCEIARTRAYKRTRVRTPRTHATLARPAGNYREPRRRSVPPIMITRCDTVIDGVSILCLRIAQKSSSISSEMKNASGKPRLLCNASRASDAAIISDCRC